MHLVPRICGPNHSFRIHVFQGKNNLLRKLPARLKGYKRWLPAEWRIVVLIDQDQYDCKELKALLEEAARDAQFTTPAAARAGQPYQVANRLAIEELEAWFFGDIPALAKAFPGVSPMLGRQAKYRNPDAIRGGTWEALQRVLQRAGYYPSGLSKINAAQKISQHMDPNQNTSSSFQLFRDTLRNLTAPISPPRPQRASPP